jgi:hypothetical protein
MVWKAVEMGQVTPRAETPARFLFAMFQGGGNIPQILPIVARLVARGHAVRVLAGPGVRANRLPVSARFRERVAASGATLVPFPEPTTHPLDEAPPPRWLARGWTPQRLASASASVLPRRCPRRLPPPPFSSSRTGAAK